jgi:hypothetical protein
MERLGSDKAHYEYFDFHRECKGMRFDRVSVLIDRLRSALENQGSVGLLLALDVLRSRLTCSACPASSTCQPPRRSPRTCRHRSSVPTAWTRWVSCRRPLPPLLGSLRLTPLTACSDRTNVVQSALAKHVLNRQLQIAGVLGKETVDDHPDFIHIFRNGQPESRTVVLSGSYRLTRLALTPPPVWADHADTISIPYSGTGALKTDFTRLGTRTKVGVLNDGKNSVMRWIKNNFFDGRKQVSRKPEADSLAPSDRLNCPARISI